MIDLVAVDADDTLWHNEPLYTYRRERFRELLARYEPEERAERSGRRAPLDGARGALSEVERAGGPGDHAWAAGAERERAQAASRGAGGPGDIEMDDRLYEVELRNLKHFGYGVKGFVLSLIETAIELTGGRLETADVSTIIDWGREMLAAPTELLDGVREAVEALAQEFPIILVTKGDLLDQQSKLARSGLGHHFKGIEIVSEKDARVYRSVMTRYGIQPERFVMVGNSLRSDILPAIEAGAHAVYVPYEISWVHERVTPEKLANVRYHEIPHMRDLPAVLRSLDSSGGPKGLDYE